MSKTSQIVTNPRRLNELWVASQLEIESSESRNNTRIYDWETPSIVQPIIAFIAH
jgi:hypothetical protein